jgi:general stress protein YciG
MDPDDQRKIAQLGGKAQGAHNNRGNFRNRSKADRIAAGRKGGQMRARLGSLPSDDVPGV